MVAAVLMVAMSAQAFATSKTVTVTEAGTLSTLIPASEKNAITSLTVSGTLNGTDIRFIREMAGLDIEGETTDGKLTELNIAGIDSPMAATPTMRMRGASITPPPATT